MARPCSICVHEQREAIDQAIVKRESFRSVADLFAVSKTALMRHTNNRHINNHIVKAQEKSAEAQAVTQGINLLQQMERMAERANLLFDACDRWLRDADDPSRYDIGPRAEDVRITYTVRGEDGRPRTKKEWMAELLGRLEDNGIPVVSWETKRADPRELVLKAAAQLKSQLELFAKLTGQLKEGINVNVGVAVQNVNGTQWDLSALAPDEVKQLEGLLCKVGQKELQE